MVENRTRTEKFLVFFKISMVGSSQDAFLDQIENYDRLDQPLPRNNWPQSSASILKEDPILFAGRTK